MVNMQNFYTARKNKGEDRREDVFMTCEGALFRKYFREYPRVLTTHLTHSFFSKYSHLVIG